MSRVPSKELAKIPLLQHVQLSLNKSFQVCILQNIITTSNSFVVTIALVSNKMGGGDAVRRENDWLMKPGIKQEVIYQTNVVTEGVT